MVEDIQLVKHTDSGDGITTGLADCFSKLLDDQLAHSVSLSSPHSVRAYRGDLRRFHAWRGYRLISKGLIEEYLWVLNRNKLSPSYVNRCLCAIRWYIKSIYDCLFDNFEIVQTITIEQRSEILDRLGRALQARKPRGERTSGIEKGRYIPSHELLALLKACEKGYTFAGIRDKAMFALAYSIGPRVHEIANLRLEDVHQFDGQESVYKIRIIGKGNKERPIVPLIEGSPARYLQDWMQVRGPQPGALFCFITRSGLHSKGQVRRTDKHLTTDALAKVLARRRIQANIAHLTWHDFRRTYISDIITEFDLVTAQKVIGHSSVNITSNYDRSWKEKARRIGNLRQF